MSRVFAISTVGDFGAGWELPKQLGRKAKRLTPLRRAGGGGIGIFQSVVAVG